MKAEKEPDYKKLWGDIKEMLDGMASGELPIGNHGELSQIISIRATMENLEKHTLKELENPEIICASFHRLWITQPDHCYNCVNRSGYPMYLFGDSNCQNFVPIIKGQERII